MNIWTPDNLLIVNTLSFNWLYHGIVLLNNANGIANSRLLLKELLKVQSDLGLHDLLFIACQAENIGALCNAITVPIN